MMSINYRISKISLRDLASLIVKHLQQWVSTDEAFERLKNDDYQWHGSNIRRLIANQMKSWCYDPRVQLRQWHNVVPLQIRSELALLVSWTEVSPTFKAQYCALGDDAIAQTYSEVGIFCDGDLTPDSWFLLSHININESMSLSETLTINATISFWSAG